MSVSIIYCFRDREIERVQRSFTSIYNQLEEKDEIIFIDYGSQQRLSKKLSNYFSEYKKIKYVYVDAVGMLWNRGHALNIGVKQSKNDTLITADIDLIFSSNFLKKIKKEFLNKDLLNYRCYYLPKNFSKHQYISAKPKKIAKHLKISRKTALGLMIVKKQLFEKVHGYDEYYRIWGLEDNDLIHRFDKLNIKRSWFLDNEAFVFHQWHESSNYRNENFMPNGWSSHMQSYYDKYNSKIIRSERWGELIERKLFQLEYFDFEIDISKEIPLYISQKMNVLIHSDQKSNTYRFIAKTDPYAINSRLNKFTRWFNKKSNNLNLPILLESEIYYFSKFRKLNEYRDLFYYFVLLNEDVLEDYQIVQNTTRIELKIKIERRQ